jgi:hypothetical protein
MELYILDCQRQMYFLEKEPSYIHQVINMLEKFKTIKEMAKEHTHLKTGLPQ